jgi:hypothetical protein
VFEYQRAAKHHRSPPQSSVFAGPQIKLPSGCEHQEKSDFDASSAAPLSSFLPSRSAKPMRNQHDKMAARG